MGRMVACLLFFSAVIVQIGLSKSGVAFGGSSRLYCVEFLELFVVVN